uniref:Uncharacterized protein n=1 Tax=Mantoniella antarctica TaxID=81844 RepID=A0A7S0S848_9CHLO
MAKKLKAAAVSDADDSSDDIGYTSDSSDVSDDDISTSAVVNLESDSEMPPLASSGNAIRRSLRALRTFWRRTTASTCRVQSGSCSATRSSSSATNARSPRR